MSFFEKLPSELQCQVAESSSRATLLGLASTSRALHRLLTPLVYRVIDLSSHNGPDIEIRTEDGPFPADWVEFRKAPADDVVYDKQRMLMETLRRNPSLAHHTRVLRWTTVEFSYYTRLVELTSLWDRMQAGGMTKRQYKRSLEDYTFNCCTDRLWELFSLFTQVQEVDIAFVNEKRESDGRPDPPPALFPRARSMRLSGVASLLLIKPILAAAEPDSLEQLYLNNLNQFAEYDGIQPQLPPGAGSRPMPFPRQTIEPGPMRGHLLEFAGRWPNLHTLVIDTVGQTSHSSRLSTSQDRKWDLDAEDQRYSEIGAFIRSQAHSLRVLRFQQGCTENKWKDGWHRSLRARGLHPPPDGQRPMDARFLQYILPAIAESDWPRLESMEIFGVASHTFYDATEDKRLNAALQPETVNWIKAALPPAARLDIRPYATRVFYCETLSGIYVDRAAREDSVGGTEEEDESEN